MNEVFEKLDEILEKKEKEKKKIKEMKMKIYINIAEYTKRIVILPQEEVKMKIKVILEMEKLEEIKTPLPILKG